MSIKAVIFDLDGVIVTTDENHYQSWKKISSEEGIPFDRELNEKFRGVSRMECLEILLNQTDKTYTEEEKKELATRKNNYYRSSLNDLNKDKILPNVMNILEILKEKGVKIAVGSSSRNTPFILEQIGLKGYFDAVADGNQIENSKPDPEVFLLAAKKMNVPPERCLVIEDADAGVEAAVNGGMKAFAVGSAVDNEKADYRAEDLSQITVDTFLKV